VSVYVDPMMACIPNHNWRWTSACHLTADAIDELHAFAALIGLKRCWFQNRRGRNFPHYDLTEGKRREAVAAGAIELTRRQAVERMRAARGDTPLFGGEA